jgi:NADH:ubiquinone oxidoreductase subunit F (NADH-binding)
METTSDQGRVHDVTGAEPVVPGPGPAVLQIGPARLTNGFDRHERIDRAAHERIHGRPHPLGLGDLTELAAAGALCERDATAFPFARKLRAVADAAAAHRSTRPIVVVDGTERDPGSAKDTILLTRAPHLVLDGAVLAAGALGAREIVVGVVDGPAAASVRHAIMERDMAATSRVVRVSESFLTAESGAPARGGDAVRGGHSVPDIHGGRGDGGGSGGGGDGDGGGRSGVGGLPTLLSNAETLAQLAVLASLGVREYRDIGIPPEPGTVLLTVTGSARFPAIVEIPSGAPLIHLLDLCAAGVGSGVLVGGYHGAWLGRENATAAEVSRESMASAGGVLGAGIIMPLGRRTCPLGECAAVARQLADDAARCAPCRPGLAEIATALSGLAGGRDGTAALRTLREAGRHARGRIGCRHLGGMARFAASAFDVFAADVAEHLARGSCGRPVLGLLPTRRALTRLPPLPAPRIRERD